MSISDVLFEAASDIEDYLAHSHAMYAEHTPRIRVVLASMRELQHELDRSPSAAEVARVGTGSPSPSAPRPPIGRPRRGHPT
jgi:hypothetical protein